ncbi:protein kinase-like protein 1 [Leptotrombidium deliense]|uniref:Protein kinase-like protein 1 n=1 Tax=Leptotrombidium deliense TaxID=299467 RepID=A0A443RV55_9ACAR|nr:protein kinase-like protein 1 [Leptotrombidium deliense]
MKQKLGAGAFATVFKAVKANQTSACKVIDTTTKKKHRYNDLKSELYVLQKVQHQNLIRLYEHFMIDDTVYLFIEFAPGGTVSDHVRKNGPLSETESKRLFKQMCGAVHHMHMKGISHRDLKLGNILLSEKGECKVTDFGLSRLSYRRDKGIIFTNKYSGTEPYMSSEILCLKFKTAEEAKKWYYDPLPADIWALGICLYAMINKAYPFNPEDKDLMLSNQLNRKIRNKLSEEAKDLMLHLLNREVMSRVTFHCINAHSWLNTDAGEDKAINK